MQNLLVPVLGRGRPSGGGDGEWRFNCPFCGENQQSFSVNFQREQYLCFRAQCGAKGSVEFLAKRLGVPYETACHPQDPNALRNRLLGLGEPKAVVAPKVEMPELVPIQPGTEAWHYLMARGLTVEDIYLNELSVSPRDSFSRIYFPMRDPHTGEFCYWVARKMRAETWGPKYINPGSSVKKTLLYRQHLINTNYPASACEGPLSAIVAGNAFATLGVKFSNEQIQAMVDLGCPILSAMDGEAFTYSLKLTKLLTGYGRESSVVPLPYLKDPADLGRATYNWYVTQSFTMLPGEVSDLRHRLARLN